MDVRPVLTEPILARRQPSWRSPQMRLAAELIVLFIALPLALPLISKLLGIRLVFLLAALLPLIAGLLLIDRAFSFRAAFVTSFRLRDLAMVVAHFVPAAVALSLLVFWFLPDQFLFLPRVLPDLWILILIFYPLLSAASQELIYRVFFFHRYGPLFGERRAALIWINAALFAYGHIIFGNWIAVALTFVGGLLFAWRYERTKSFWPVFLEHSLYGDLIFTIGLGRYLLARF